MNSKSQLIDGLDFGEAYKNSKLMQLSLTEKHNLKLIKFDTMKTETYNIDLAFDQILDLVRQLPKKDKLRLSKELEREIVGVKLTALLKAFKADDLDQDTINKEVEIVRAELYAKSKVK